jgi:hypothetical protein
MYGNMVIPTGVSGCFLLELTQVIVGKPLE